MSLRRRDTISKFRFSTKINKAQNEADVIVYRPDGSSSTYCVVGNEELYKGKWSLLGKAALVSAHH